jgi:hypothetical protein
LIARINPGPKDRGRKRPNNDRIRDQVRGAIFVLRGPDRETVGSKG